MNDYISREALEKWLLTEMASLDSEADRQYVIERLREDIPAADVRTVVRGHWIFDRGDLATCSNCRSEILKRDVRNHRFCHYCGADMRKEAQE